MAWQAYRVVLRLRSPLHIGWRKVGNIQLTRPYVTGRVLWGALTERLTRDGALKAQDYEEVGAQVHRGLAFTYFYPALREGSDGYTVRWPWDDEAAFRAAFLGSYASTALEHAQRSAAEGTLHEIEFISPHTRENDRESRPVFLLGYIFAAGEALDWRGALARLQLGGERGYGWGRVEPVEIKLRDWPDLREEPFFGGCEPRDDVRPRLRLTGDAPLLAHALAADFEVSGVEGPVEPLVGRETRPDGRFGAHVSPARICYAPGGRVQAETEVTIGHYGIWESA